MDFDPFYLFRYLLCVVCTIYTAARTGQTLLRWQRWLWADGRSQALVRRYLMAQLVRVRLRRFGLDVLQIVVLLAVLWQVILLHERI